MFTYREVKSFDVEGMIVLLKERQLYEINQHQYKNEKVINDINIKNYLNDLLTKDYCGIVAHYNNKIVGYIVAKLIEFPLRGKHAWVPYEGLVVDNNFDTKDIIRNMYKYAAEKWVQKGFFNHSINIPLGNPVYFEALMHLSFAIEQVYALLDLRDFNSQKFKNNYDIRSIDIKDSSILGEMSSIISNHQSKSPTFNPVPKEVLQRIKEAFENLVHEDDVIVYLAEKEKETLGFFEFEFVNEDLMIPKACIELVTAGVINTKRNKGVGKQLMNFSVKELKKLNYNYIITDWKVSNLQASNFYPKFNFKAFAYRMQRVIQPAYSNDE